MLQHNSSHNFYRLAEYVLKFSRENKKKGGDKEVAHVKRDPQLQLYTKKERLLWTIYCVIIYAFLTWFIWGVKFTINGVIG